MATGNDSLLLDVGSGEGSGQNNANGVQQNEVPQGGGEQNAAGRAADVIRVPASETDNEGLTEHQLTAGVVRMVRDCKIMSDLEKVPVKDSLFYAAAGSLRQNSDRFDHEEGSLVQALNFELNSGYTWGNQEAAALAERLGMGLVLIDDGTCYHFNIHLRVGENLY